MASKKDLKLPSRGLAVDAVEIYGRGKRDKPKPLSVEGKYLGLLIGTEIQTKHHQRDDVASVKALMAHDFTFQLSIEYHPHIHTCT